MPAPDSLPAGPGGRHPLVQRILEGAAPEAIRLNAARGVLPLPAQDLLLLQVSLLQDSAPAVVKAAADSLGKVPVETVAPLLRDPECEPALIDHFARSGRLTGEMLGLAIAHPSIPEETLETLAASGSGEVLNLITTNEVRIIGNPRLLDLMRSNPNLSGDIRRRLAELARDFIGKQESYLGPAAVPAAAPPTEISPPDADGLPPVPPGEEATEGIEGAEGQAPASVMTPEEEKDYEEAMRRTPAFQKIMKLGVGERVQLAMKGDAEERAILVRDSAKMVALQVLKCPKLSETEITRFAGMRNVHEDILRIIASHRDWTKTYAVIHNLVRNPKTPPGLSVQFLARLGTRDLRTVQGDKNIPEVLRRQARNLFVARTQPPKRKIKKAH